MLVLSPQLHFKFFKDGNLIEGISVPPWPGSPLSGLTRSHWRDPPMQPPQEPSPSFPRVPQFVMPSPGHLQRFCFLECRITGREDSSSWVSSPSPQRLDMPPHPILPPTAVAQDCWRPCSLTSSPLPLERRNTTKTGFGGAVTSSQLGPGCGLGGVQSRRAGRRADRK